MLPHELFVTYLAFAVLLFSGLGIDFYLYSHAREKGVKGISSSVPWGASEILMMLFIYLFYEYMLWRIEGALLSCNGLAAHAQGLTNTFVIINNTILYSVVLMALWEYLYRKYEYGIERFVNFEQFKRSFFIGVLGYIGFVPILFFLTVLTRLLSSVFEFELVSQNIVNLLMQEETGWRWLIFIVLIVFAAPIVEECFFRGLLYPVLKRRIGIFGAICVSALLFSILHWSAVAFLPIIGVGVSLALLYEYTGSLITPIIFHICHNGCAIIVLLSLQNPGNT